MNAKTFFSDRPIAYHPCLAKACGSVTAALFLSQLAYWNDKGRDRDGWIYKVEREMEEETGLSRKEQETARKRLVWIGVLKEERRGIPAKMWYLIDWDALTILLDEFEKVEDAIKLCETDNLEVPDGHSSSAEEAISTENTSESTQREPNIPAVVVSPEKNIFQTWESTGMVLTQYYAERLAELEKEYTAPWVIGAIEQAARNNVRKLSYMEGILKRWHTVGAMDSPSNGKGKSPDNNFRVVRTADGGFYG